MFAERKVERTNTINHNFCTKSTINSRVQQVFKELQSTKAVGEFQKFVEPLHQPNEYHYVQVQQIREMIKRRSWKGRTLIKSLRVRILLQRSNAFSPPPPLSPSPKFGVPSSDALAVCMYNDEGSTFRIYGVR